MTRMRTDEEEKMARDRQWYVVGGLCLVYLGLAACPQSSGRPGKLADGDIVTVAAIVKGDEIAVVDRAAPGGTIPVRLIGIDAFRSIVTNADVAAITATASQFLGQQVLNQQVRIKFGSPMMDVHGRYLAYVEKEGHDINRLMVAEGLVLVYSEFGFEREADYLQAEATARAAKKSIWSNDRLTNLAVARRQEWLQSRAARDGSVPAYYR
jgi:endonuclease YncB( thermonuclease family)